MGGIISSGDGGDIRRIGIYIIIPFAFGDMLLKNYTRCRYSLETLSEHVFQTLKTTQNGQTSIELILGEFPIDIFISQC